MARAIAQKMVTEGEKYMNALDHKTAHDQVSYIEQQVSAWASAWSRRARRFWPIRMRMVWCRPVTPWKASRHASRLDAELSDLMTKRAALAGYPIPAAPDIVQSRQPDCRGEIPTASRTPAHGRQARWA
jgi:capsular polysaccharide transport system permease protein